MGKTYSKRDKLRAIKVPRRRRISSQERKRKEIHKKVSRICETLERMLEKEI